MKKGFTLAELMGVIVVIAILALIVTTTVYQNINSSHFSACKTQENAIIEAAKMYLTDNLNENRTKIYVKGDLQGGGYLDDDIVNPVNNERYNLQTYVAISKDSNGSSYELKYKGADAKTCNGEKSVDIVDLIPPTYSEQDTAEGKTVTITYPEECMDNSFICTYSKDGAEAVRVTNITQQEVAFNANGNLLAKVSYEGEEISSTHVVEFVPILKSWASNATTDFHNSTYKSNITSVDIVDLSTTTLTVPEINNTTCWDVSEKGTKSVKAWIIDDPENTGKYKLYIGGKGKLYANSDSSYLFYNFSGVKTMNLSLLDTSNVANMKGMFHYCRNLIGIDITHFNTSNVTNMSHMFFTCLNLTTVDVSNFNTSKVTNMCAMFGGDGVTEMSFVSLDLSSFNTSKVTDMSRMFNHCHKLVNLNLSSFNTSKVTEMYQMFYECNSLETLNLSNFDVSKVTSMSSVFYHCTNLKTLNLKNWCPQSATSMYTMFNHCKSLISLDLSSFNTAKVTTMYAMFTGCESLTNLKITSFNTAKVTNMEYMFKGCSGLKTLNLSSFNTSKVTNMYGMFDSCSGLTSLDLSSFDTSSLTSTYYMFNNCTALKTIYVSNKFVTSQITGSNRMFWGCTSLVGGNGTKYSSTYTDITYARIDKSGQKGYFTQK